CNNRQAVLEWRKPDDHGSEITKFTIEMKTGFPPYEWQIVLEETAVTPETYQAIITLSPWVNYTFRIIAYNSYGSSEPGMPAKTLFDGIHCSTDMSVPYLNPEEVSAKGSEPDNMVIKWKPMKKYDWNAPELKYLIRYKENKSELEWIEFLVEDPLANETIIRELPTYTEYLVQVQAVNKEGKSSLKPESIIGYSGEDVPLEAPKNFRLSKFNNFSSAEFAWNPVSPETVRGLFKGYKLVYWEDERPLFTDYIRIPVGFNDATISGLTAMKNYSAKIHVINEKYESPSSQNISFNTPEGAPSKVHNLRVHAVGANSIIVEWEPPRHPNGNIRGYFITFENSTSGEIEETYVLHRQQHYLHESLVPDSPYKVSVWAETNGGEGPKVTRLVRTWHLKDPDIPTIDIKHMSPKSILIKWKPSNGSEWQMPGSSFYVNYSKANSNDWKRTEDIDLPTTSVIVDNLEEETNYVLIAVAKEGPRISAALPIIYYNEGKHPVAHINRENLQSSLWFIIILFIVFIGITLFLCMCCWARTRSGKYAVKRKELESGVYSGSGVMLGNIETSEEEHKKFLEYQYGYSAKEPQML
uniref:Fibronectin type-III domain-containing protein n=1 Tax=Panagrolaimus sp. PS1159 TaxID=55785 RepID=A0AC35FEE7_9BILA